MFLHIRSQKWNYLDKQATELNNLPLWYKIDYTNNFVLYILYPFFFQISVINLYEETEVNGKTVNFQFITTCQKQIL